MTDEDDLRRWIAGVRAGSLARRDFLARLAALGVAAPMASLLLAEAGIAQPTSAHLQADAARRRRHAEAALLAGADAAEPAFRQQHQGCRLDRAPFYESLARFDADGQLVPILAGEIPSSDNGGIAADGRSTTWKLKRGVTWHDGKPFTADDVIFNWRFATDPATAAFTGGVYENVKAIEKIDTHAVRIVFEKPHAGLDAHLESATDPAAPVRTLPRCEIA